MSDGNGRIIQLRDHLPKDKGSKPCTRAQAQAEAIKVAEFYMAQVPELVAHMLASAFQAHGIELKPPPPPPKSPMETTAASAEVRPDGVPA